MILYLDYDGALHSDSVYLDKKGRVFMRGGGSLFEYASRLTQILAPYPSVQIVLSTSWVRVRGFHRARRMLPVELRDRVIGATWHSCFKRDPDMLVWWESSTRYQQIMRDVQRRQPANWAAIDDDVVGWPGDQSKFLIACDREVGLSEPGVRLKLEGLLARYYQIVT